MSTAGNDGTPFVNGIEDGQRFSAIARIQAARTATAENQNSCNHDMLHKKISPHQGIVRN
jgi:hypothetical protein